MREAITSRFDYGHLIEINSHSLFSKWFSESGKLVQKMFEVIEDLVNDPRALVCVLIDEVESLAAARNRCYAIHEISCESNSKRTGAFVSPPKYYHIKI